MKRQVARLQERVCNISLVPLHQPFKIVPLVDWPVWIGEATAQLFDDAARALGHASHLPERSFVPAVVAFSPTAERIVAGALARPHAARRIPALAVRGPDPGPGSFASACPARPLAAPRGRGPAHRPPRPSALRSFSLGATLIARSPPCSPLRSPSASFMSFSASSNPFSPFMPKLFSMRCSSAERSRSARCRLSSCGCVWSGLRRHSA